MSRYRKISVRMWGDDKFSTISRPQPNAQSLWIYLLTGPHTTALPCAFAVGEASLAEALGWPIRGFRKAFQELFDKGMVQNDWKSRLVFIPNALKHNPPENPNVVIGWKSSFDELPDCPLKKLIYAGVRAYLLTFVEAKGFSELFAKPFHEVLPEELPKTDTVTGTDTRTDTEGEREAPPPKFRFGEEFQSVELTEVEHAKLEHQFNGRLEIYINRLDRYSRKNARKFNSYSDHYAVLLDWYDKDVDEGKVPPRNKQAPTPALRTHHRCNRCEPVHSWPCDETEPCGRTDELACPEFMQKRVERMAAQA